MSDDIAQQMTRFGKALERAALEIAPAFAAYLAATEKAERALYDLAVAQGIFPKAATALEARLALVPLGDVADWQGRLQPFLGENGSQ